MFVCFCRASKTNRSSPRTTSFIKQVEKHPLAHSQIRRSPVNRSNYWNDRNQFYRHDSSQRQSQYDSLEMRRRCDWKNEYNTFQWRHPHSYQQETRYHSPSRQQRTRAIVEATPSSEFQKVKLKKKQNVDANKDNISKKSRKDISRCVDVPHILRESRDNIPGATGSIQNYPEDLLRKHTMFEDVKNLAPQSSSSNLRRKHLQKQGALPKGAFCLDVDEGVHSEGSSSTDVDDRLSHTSRHSTFNRKK